MFRRRVSALCLVLAAAYASAAPDDRIFDPYGLGVLPGSEVSFWNPGLWRAETLLPSGDVPFANSWVYFQGSTPITAYLRSYGGFSSPVNAHIAGLRLFNNSVSLFGNASSVLSIGSAGNSTLQISDNSQLALQDTSISLDGHLVMNGGQNSLVLSGSMGSPTLFISGDANLTGQQSISATLGAKIKVGGITNYLGSGASVFATTGATYDSLAFNLLGSLGESQIAFTARSGGSVLLGSAILSNSIDATATVFSARALTSTAVDPSDIGQITVSNNVFLNGMSTGTLAKADYAGIVNLNAITASGSDARFTLDASNNGKINVGQLLKSGLAIPALTVDAAPTAGGQINFASIVLSGANTLNFTPGAAGTVHVGSLTQVDESVAEGNLNFVADQGSVLIDSAKLTVGGGQTWSARNGGTLALGVPYSFTEEGRVRLSASGIADFNLSATSGGHLQLNNVDFEGSNVNILVDGGSTITGGGDNTIYGYTYAHNGTVGLNAASSTLDVENSSIANVSFDGSNYTADIDGSYLSHVDFLGTNNVLRVTNSTLANSPSSTDQTHNRLEVRTVGSTGGRASAHIEGSSLQDVDLAVGQSVGSGSYNVLSISGASNVTGTLSAGAYSTHTPGAAINYDIFVTEASKLKLSRLTLGVGASGGQGGSISYTPTGRGNLTLRDGSQLIVSGYTTSYGWNNEAAGDAEVVMGSGAIFDFQNGAVFVGSASSEADYQLINGSMVIGTGGVVRGEGIYDGNRVILRGGTLSPGYSPGHLTMTGDYVQESGDLIIEIGGLGDGEFDSLTASSFLFNGGHIIFRAYDGFTGTDGTINPFQGGLVTFSSGFNFSKGIINETGFGISINNLGQVTVNAVPEPASLAALGFGAVALLRRRKKVA